VEAIGLNCVYIYIYIYTPTASETKQEVKKNFITRLADNKASNPKDRRLPFQCWMQYDTVLSFCVSVEEVHLHHITSSYRHARNVVKDSTRHHTIQPNSL